VSFAIITLCVASQQVFIVIVVVDFVIDSVRKLWIYRRISTKCVKLVRLING
jgi:lipoprotein signal peptidase